MNAQNSVSCLWLDKDSTSKINVASRCATVVRAIDDDVIVAIDSPYRAGPHNFVLAHPNGYCSLLGELLERSLLQISQRIDRDDPVGLGDALPRPTCGQAHHQHLEIRDATVRSADDPVHSIQADW